jgi:hypothetical protein
MQLSLNAITKHMARLRRRIYHYLPELRPLLAATAPPHHPPICDQDALEPPYAN